MHRLFFASLETAAAAVFLIPIFFLLKRKMFHNRKTTVVALFFSLYLCTVYAIAGLPNVLYIRFHPNFNFVPFRYFFSDHTTLLNVLLFIPLGVFLPVLRVKFRRFLPTLLFGFLTSAFVELFQIFTLRATDINDLLTNTIGTAIGYVFGRVILKTYPQLSLDETDNELKTIIIHALFVMFFLQPFLSRLLWNIITP